jgi:sugar/nucleoside kinase (ribokinase family)
MSFDFDVVGIGALNLDYITTRAITIAGSSIPSRIESMLQGRGQDVELGTERYVDADTIYEAIDAASMGNPQTTLGGSAFNAVRAMAKTQVGLRLGYVGVEGHVPVIGMSFVRQLAELGIDRNFVRQDTTNPCGICLSVLTGADRTLLTHAGANSQMAKFLRDEFDEVVNYLCTARVIHVTSFLDSDTADVLALVLAAVKSRALGTLVCFDPGHVWSVERSPAVQAIVQLSDYLLVNYREFQELAQHKPGESNDDIASRILESIASVDARLIVKRPAGIWCYRRVDSNVAGTFYGQAPLREEEIQDSTGAGDVFAAGLLTALTSDRFQIELGSLLGMTLARHQLGYVGTSGHTQFAQVTDGFIRSLDQQRRKSGLPRGVFISHGHSPVWRVVEDFVDKYLGFPVLAFESDSWAGRQVTEALSEYLDSCSLAVCVLTAEDDVESGGRQARQNVIHELGLFQGRYGKNRVILLVEEGCDFVPDTPPERILTFPGSNIDHTFYRLGEIIHEECQSDDSG